MQENLLSVVVPVYNVDKYLRRAIDSILNQTYTNIEIILIDDGSTDESGYICDEYKKRNGNIVVAHQKNQGVSVARNHGLKLAKGAFITFVDPDDWLEANIYHIAVKTMIETNADIGVYDFYNVYVNEDGETKKENKTWGRQSLFQKVSGKEVYFSVLKNTAVLWNKIFKRELIKDIQFPHNISYGEDLLFLTKALEKIQSAVIIPICGYNYFINRAGNVVSASINKSCLQFLDVSYAVYEITKKNNAEVVGVARIRTAVAITSKKIDPTYVDENVEYIEKCQSIIRRIERKDKLKYLVNSHISFKDKIMFCLLQVSVKKVIQLRKLVHFGGDKA